LFLASTSVLAFFCHQSTLAYIVSSAAVQVDKTVFTRARIEGQGCNKTARSMGVLFSARTGKRVLRLRFLKFGHRRYSDTGNMLSSMLRAVKMCFR